MRSTQKLIADGGVVVARAARRSASGNATNGICGNHLTAHLTVGSLVKASNGSLCGITEADLVWMAGLLQKWKMMGLMERVEAEEEQLRREVSQLQEAIVRAREGRK